MGSTGEKRSTPKSSPLKSMSLSPNYSLFNSPDTQSSLKRSIIDENDPFKSPLPVKKSFKKRYNPNRSPSFASPSSNSLWSSSSFSANWHQRPIGPKFYRAKRKLPVHKYSYGNNLKRFCGNSKRISPNNSKNSPFQRRKGKLNFTDNPKFSLPESKMEVWGGNEYNLSPEIPLLSTPQQRRIATAQLTGQGLRSNNQCLLDAKSESLSKSGDKTVLQFNKPERSYCDSQSDEESVIEECSSPENVHGDEADGWQIQMLRKSFQDTSLGRNNTSTGINLLDESLDTLSRSQKKYQLEKFSIRQRISPKLKSTGEKCSSRQEREGIHIRIVSNEAKCNVDLDLVCFNLSWKKLVRVKFENPFVDRVNCIFKGLWL